MKYDNEIPKYMKKKESSVSKSKTKSKHKHEYVDCLLLENNREPYKASCCKICGKVSNIKFFESEEINYGEYRMLHSEEILKKYKNLPVIQVKDIFQKYVPVDVKK